MGKKIVSVWLVVVLAVGLVAGFVGGYTYKNFRAVETPPSGEAPNSNYVLEQPVSSETGVNWLLPSKIVYKKTYEYECPPGFTRNEDIAWPFYRSVIADSFIRDSSLPRYDEEQGFDRASNPRYGRSVLLAYDNHYKAEISTDGLSIDAKLVSRIKKTRPEPQFLYLPTNWLGGIHGLVEDVVNANMDRTAYYSESIFGTLDPGASVPVRKQDVVAQLCSKPGAGGPG